jgi:hypothetical protein
MNKKIEGTTKQFEYFYTEGFSYGLIHISAKAARPFAEIEILGKNNELLHKTKIEVT